MMKLKRKPVVFEAYMAYTAYNYTNKLKDCSNKRQEFFLALLLDIIRMHR